MMSVSTRVMFSLGYFLLMILWGCMMSYEIKNRKDNKVLIILDGILVVLYAYLCIVYITA